MLSCDGTWTHKCDCWSFSKIAHLEWSVIWFLIHCCCQSAVGKCAISQPPITAFYATHLTALSANLHTLCNHGLHSNSSCRTTLDAINLDSGVSHVTNFPFLKRTLPFKRWHYSCINFLKWSLLLNRPFWTQHCSLKEGATLAFEDSATHAQRECGSLRDDSTHALPFNENETL